MQLVACHQCAEWKIGNLILWSYALCIFLAFSYTHGEVSSSSTAWVVPCIRRFGTIKLDGSLNDLVWRSLTPLGQFSKMPSGRRPNVQTEVRVCYDDHMLYVIATCREPHVNRIRARCMQRDGQLRQVAQFA